MPDYLSKWTGPQIDEAVGRQYHAGESYAAWEWVAHKGYLWRNTSGGTVTGVEPGTDYNVWNVGFSNENLLDNPWFTVNQRGATSYTGGVVGYTTVDRIKMTYGSGPYSVSIDDSGLTVGPGERGVDVYPHQILEPAIIDYITGTTITCSCKLSDGNILAYSFFRSAGSNQLKTVGNIRFGVDSTNRFRFDVRGSYGNSATFRAIKLELGPVSTLANDGPPDDAAELAKCQRYYWRGELVSNIISNGGEAFFNLPVLMRARPSLSFWETSGGNMGSVRFGGNIPYANRSAYSIGTYGTGDSSRNSTIIRVASAESVLNAPGKAATFSIEASADL